MTAQVSVRYFAAIRERLGDGEAVPVEALPDATVGGLLAWLQARSQAHAQALDPKRGVRMAHNQSLCRPGQLLGAGDEVAFFPPVTGG